MRIAHLTTVDISLAVLLRVELEVDLEAGHEVVGISAPGPYVAELESLGVRHVAVPALSRSWTPVADLRAAGQLMAALRRVRLDVLHTHTPKAGILGRVLGRLARIPIVVNTCHGLWAQPSDALAKRALVYVAEATAARFSHAELYQNDQDRHTLRWALPAGRSRTVGNGVDLERFRPDPAGAAAVRTGLGLAPDDLLVGGVGRRVAEKGIAEFSAAARQYGSRARFVWVGPDDPDKSDALRDAEDGVEFLGMRRDMPALYSAFDVFVLPSYREGFSRSAMEAAACGTAMVLSDVRGCREIGTDGEHLLLVPPRDRDALTAAVARLLDDGALRARLARSARDRAASAFDQRAVARASLDAYRRVAVRRGIDWPRRP